MKKTIKIILILAGIFLTIILLDTFQARIFKHSPFISLQYFLQDNSSWVDKGIIIDTYYCVKDKDIITVSWHSKKSKFTCPIDNIETTYDGYKKTSTLTNDKVDTNTLVMFAGILYGRSYKIIDYAGSDDITNTSIGIIDKLIPDEYVPEINGETNKEEILNALVFDGGNNNIVLLYKNEYVLFEKVNK